MWSCGRLEVSWVIESSFVGLGDRSRAVDVPAQVQVSRRRSGIRVLNPFTASGSVVGWAGRHWNERDFGRRSSHVNCGVARGYPLVAAVSRVAELCLITKPQSIGTY